jgi:predicted ArsR family transcriptional regulator
MQKTRENIIGILKTRGQSTVDELSRELGLTSVTVRHHLEILRSEGLIASPEPLRREGPGRPQYLYRLSEQAAELFPSHYDLLAQELLKEMGDSMAPAEVGDALERIAERIAGQARMPRNADLSTRVEALVEFLNEQGYMASSEEDADGRILLYVRNCPYERVARKTPAPCVIDSHVLSRLLENEFSRVESFAKGDRRCVYVISEEA